MSMLKDAIGNSIRCARHKFKTDRARLAAAAAGNQFEEVHVEDGEEMLLDGNEY